MIGSLIICAAASSSGIYYLLKGKFASSLQKKTGLRNVNEQVRV
jgi:hypothetical protein